MPSTSRYTFPYPALADTPNGPVQVQALADRMEVVLGPIEDAGIAATAANLVAGGEYRSTSSQGIGVTGATKLTLGTTVTAASGITWNGSNTFTIVTAGRYSMSGNISYGYSVSNNVLLNIGATTYANPGWSGLSPAEAQTDNSVSVVRFLPAGATVSLWVYLNSTSASPITRAELQVWRVS